MSAKFPIDVSTLKPVVDLSGRAFAGIKPYLAAELPAERNSASGFVHHGYISAFQTYNGDTMAGFFRHLDDACDFADLGRRSSFAISKVVYRAALVKEFDANAKQDNAVILVNGQVYPVSGDTSNFA